MVAKVTSVFKDPDLVGLVVRVSVQQLMVMLSEGRKESSEEERRVVEQLCEVVQVKLSLNLGPLFLKSWIELYCYWVCSEASMYYSIPSVILLLLFACVGSCCVHSISPPNFQTLKHLFRS